jgi:hypothetical protein
MPDSIRPDGQRSSVDASPIRERDYVPGRCANCGTERDDLVAEAPGCPPLCPTIAECDATLYYRAAIADHRQWVTPDA